MSSNINLSSISQSSVQCIRRTQDLMWNQENILKSWPEKLPSFAEEDKDKNGSSDKGQGKDQIKSGQGNGSTAGSTTTTTAPASTASSGSAAGKIQRKAQLSKTANGSGEFVFQIMCTYQS